MNPVAIGEVGLANLSLVYSPNKIGPRSIGLSPTVERVLARSASESFFSAGNLVRNLSLAPLDMFCVGLDLLGVVVVGCMITILHHRGWPSSLCPVTIIELFMPVLAFSEMRN